MRDPGTVVATVDGRPITARQVYGLASAYREQFDQRGIALAPQQEMELQRMALQTLINTDLMARTAKAEGIKADTKMIDGRIQADRARFKTEEEYRQALAAAGISLEQIRSDLEQQYLAEMWARARTESVKPDEATVRKVYDEHKNEFKKSDEAHVLQILVPASPADTPEKREAARKRAGEAYAKAKAGEDFGKLAAKYSQAPNAAAGGDTGFIPQGTQLREFDQAAFSLPVGQVSPVFETQAGFNVIKILERRQGQPLSWAEVKDRLSEQITSNLKGQVLEGKIAELRAKAKDSITASELEPRKQAAAAGAAGAGAPSTP
jgi:parvulin-like peptidyl-prolyl isomerase